MKPQCATLERSLLPVFRLPRSLAVKPDRLVLVLSLAFFLASLLLAPVP